MNLTYQMRKDARHRYLDAVHLHLNPFMPTVPTFAVRETQSLGQQMLELSCKNATVGTNGLNLDLSLYFQYDVIEFK